MDTSISQLLKETDEYALVSAIEVFLALLVVFVIYRLKHPMLKLAVSFTIVIWVSTLFSTPGGGGSLASELVRKARGTKDPAFAIWRLTRNATIDAAIHHKGRFKVRTIQLPSLGYRQALIQTKAAALNPVDYKLRWDLFPVLRWDSAKLIAGFDMAGVVVEMGDGCKGRFNLGDRVWGGGHGALASFVIADCEHIARIPDNLSFQQAASLYVAAVTTYEALRFSFPLKAGQELLVVGASGGCGSMGVMMAKQLGAKVTAIASGKNKEVVMSHGADRFVDYTVDEQMTQLKQETLKL
eukprot:g24861.t1